MLKERYFIRIECTVLLLYYREMLSFYSVRHLATLQFKVYRFVL